MDHLCCCGLNDRIKAAEQIVTSRVVQSHTEPEPVNIGLNTGSREEVRGVIGVKVTNNHPGSVGKRPSAFAKCQVSMLTPGISSGSLNLNWKWYRLTRLPRSST